MPYKNSSELASLNIIFFSISTINRIDIRSTTKSIVRDSVMADWVILDRRDAMRRGIERSRISLYSIKTKFA